MTQNVLALLCCACFAVAAFQPYFALRVRFEWLAFAIFAASYLL